MMNLIESVQSSWLPILLTAAPSAILFWYWKTATVEVATTTQHSQVTSKGRLASALEATLPHATFFPRQAAYSTSLNSYWSKQNREISPECVVKPRTTEEVASAVKVIKREFDECRLNGAENPTFAVRSGGHSTVPGASNVPGGIVLDLSLFNQVELAEDRASVIVGTGARWGEVSRKLDAFGLAVVGGRNSDVGVGGLTLGGGYSYFSPKYGFVCDNVLEYTIVLADGSIEIVTEGSNNQLWHALKGGTNNFGIVTTFRLRTLPCTKVWSGFLYMWSSKAPQMIRAFHDFVRGPFDESAGGPLFCISYVQQIGITLIATHLMYTKPETWPACWLSFKKIGRIWSSTKIRSLTSTTDELDGISPAGFRQLHISTTISNDLETLLFAHSTFKQKSKLLKKVKGMVWTLVLQPLHTSTMRHGAHNVFGLRDRPESLVIVLFTAVWERTADDDLVNGCGRRAIAEIDEFAREKGTADEFRYLNWCDGTQKPFESYGEENMRRLRKICEELDPDGFFQRACVGGHKLMSG